jgi:hypothetical protein
MNAMIQHFNQNFDHLRSHARKPFCQGIGAQQQRCANFRLVQRLADAGGVTAHQVDLELFQLITRYLDIAELAETGRHAIDDRAVLQSPLDHPPRGSHPLANLGSEGNGCVIPGDPRH